MTLLNVENKQETRVIHIQ